MFASKWRWLSFPTLFAVVHLTHGLSFGDGSDLTNYITHPEIKAPLLDVTVYDEKSIADGYWFIAPYGQLFQPGPHPAIYHTCHTGPHIYDVAGDLIWSGACAFQNRVACDFRAVEANGSWFLSAHMVMTQTDQKGHGVIMDSSYNVTQRLHAGPAMILFNMHELTYVNRGTRALYIVNRPLYIDMTGMILNSTADSGWLTDLGIYEVDLATRETTFLWWASEHIDLSESSAPLLGYNDKNAGWDWLHLNSVNKNDDGDYIISARNTNSIFKVSGTDGSILWRLGGTNSTFTTESFNFSRQHDAQWLSFNDKEERVIFLDNGGDDFKYSTASTSSVLVVHLDKVTNKATLEQRIWRPDGGKTKLRGNLQLMPNGNILIGWSDNCYMTEHASDGRLLLEARFRSERSVTYRSYKFPFESSPSGKPTLHATVYSAGQSSMTIYLVSWNGATSVAKWRFWRIVEDDDDTPMIGEAPWTGFETSFQTEGAERQIYVEALSADGRSLGSSEILELEISGATTYNFQDPYQARLTSGKDEL